MSTDHIRAPRGWHGYIDGNNTPVWRCASCGRGCDAGDYGEGPPRAAFHLPTCEHYRAEGKYMTAETLVKILQWAHTEGTEVCIRVGSVGYAVREVDGDADGRAVIVAELPPAPAPASACGQGWIPVAERVPDDVDYVLVYVDEEEADFEGVDRMTFAQYNGSWCNAYGHRITPPLAWQPLPEPYRGEPITNQTESEQ